jgi:hypothetical protein
MHLEIVSDTPNFCPKCTIKLEPKPTASEVREVGERSNPSSTP